MLAGTWKDFSFLFVALFFPPPIIIWQQNTYQEYFSFFVIAFLKCFDDVFFLMYPQVVFTSFSIENNVDSLLIRATVISTDLGFRLIFANTYVSRSSNSSP